METTFTSIYENCVWGNNNADVYAGSSGDGSAVNYNKDTYIPILQQFITSHKVESVADLGCGDFRCGPTIYNDLNIVYTGYDVYDKLVNHLSRVFGSDKYKFIHLDFCANKESIKNADMCILKDVIQHWPLQSIYNFLDYIIVSKKFKYILLCNCAYQNMDNTDIQTGGYRPLSSDYLPLKKYNCKRLCIYNTKEISVIVVP